MFGLKFIQTWGTEGALRDSLYLFSVPCNLCPQFFYAPGGEDGVWKEENLTVNLTILFSRPGKPKEWGETRIG